MKWNKFVEGPKNVEDLGLQLPGVNALKPVEVERTQERYFFIGGVCCYGICFFDPLHFPVSRQ
jgi:hypothetical protein